MIRVLRSSGIVQTHFLWILTCQSGYPDAEKRMKKHVTQHPFTTCLFVCVCYLRCARLQMYLIHNDVGDCGELSI